MRIGLKSKRRFELFCPKDFHHYSGVNVCLRFCRKRVCSVFKLLREVDLRGCQVES